MKLLNEIDKTKRLLALPKTNKNNHFVVNFSFLLFSRFFILDKVLLRLKLCGSNNEWNETWHRTSIVHHLILFHSYCQFDTGLNKKNISFSSFSFIDYSFICFELWRLPLSDNIFNLCDIPFQFISFKYFCSLHHSKYSYLISRGQIFISIDNNQNTKGVPCFDLNILFR